MSQLDEPSDAHEDDDDLASGGPASAPEGDEAGADEEPLPRELLRPTVRILAWAMIASILLHASPLITLFQLDLSSQAPAVETEWLGEFEDLEGLGHGGQQRWARVRDPAPASPEEKEEDPPKENEDGDPPPPEEEPKPTPEPEDKPEDPDEEPEPEPEEEPAPEEEPEPKELAQKDPEPEPPTKDDEPTQEETDAPADPAPEAEATAEVPQGLPGLEATGPSELPTLKNYAPGNARMTALLQLQHLRDTPYEEATRRLLEVVPDYRILFAQTGTDPIRAFDTLFTASADPRYLQETFFAARHSMTEDELKRALARRFADEVPWRDYRGYPIRDIVPPTIPYKDPRQILMAREGLALVVRPEWLEQLTQDQPADSPLRAPEEAPEGDGDAKDRELPELTMLEGLGRIEEAAGPETLALVSVNGLRLYVPGYGKLPRFESARVELAGVDNPRLTIDVQFRSEDRARELASECPRIKGSLIEAIPMARFMKLDIYIDRLECAAEGAYVTVAGTYTQKEFLRLIQLAQPFIPQPPALRDLPSAPPPPAPPDMGQPQAPGAATGADMGPAAQTPDATPDMGAAAPSPSPSAPASDGAEAEAAGDGGGEAAAAPLAPPPAEGPAATEESEASSGAAREGAPPPPPDPPTPGRESQAGDDPQNAPRDELPPALRPPSLE